MRPKRFLSWIGLKTLRWLARRKVRSSEPLMILLCAPLGVAVGLVVVALHEVVSWLHVVNFGLPEDASLSAGLGIDPLRLLIVPALGGAALAALALAGRYVRSREIVDPVEANALYGGRMSMLDSLRLAAATVVSNAAGASLGMEAAYSQMGSGVFSSIGQWFNLRRADLRIFVAAGAAAAIAAAFNAPLAGAFYAYELILGSYTPAALAQVAVASLAGTLTVRATLGVAPIFLVHAEPVAVFAWDYPLFALIGVAAAGIGIATMRAATACEQALRRLGVPRWLAPVVGGALISGIAIGYPQVLGSGHGAIQALFDESPLLFPLLFVLVAKMLASAVSIGCGFRGGLFSSSLYLGCLFGAAVSRGIGAFGPWLVSQHMIFVMVGMGAVAASIVGAPVTMVLLVLEVTGDFTVALAVLSGVVMSATVTRFAFGYSFSTWRFHQRGKLIRTPHDIGWIGDLTVGRMLRRDAKIVAQNLPLLRLRELVPLGSRTRAFAVDDVARYVGAIDISVAHDPDLDAAAAGLVAGDLAADRGQYLLPQMNIQEALAEFEAAELETLPVLSDAEARRIEGYLTEAYALRRYATEMERQRRADLGVSGAIADEDSASQ